MRPSHIETILAREFDSCADGQHTPVMLWGPPGVGKSQIIAGIAAQHGVPLIDIRLSQMEPTDLRGIPFRKDSNVEWSVPAMLPDAERHGPAGDVPPAGLVHLDVGRDQDRRTDCATTRPCVTSSGATCARPLAAR
jgi:hypothetical protein